MAKLSHMVAISALALVSCNTIPQEAYFNHGTPESLLDLSTEAISVDISTSEGVEDLIGWVNRETPSQAELLCSEGEPACRRAQRVLDQFNVKYTQGEESRQSVVLHYERVAVRECEHRYIDNSINPYNLSPPTFGCSVASNSVRMVTDKRQFVNPERLNSHDGEKAVQNYREYQKPTTQQVPRSVQWITNTSSTTGGGASR